MNQILCKQITDYLTNGGLFNPEMMQHDRVRNLLIECRAALIGQSPTVNLHLARLGARLDEAQYVRSPEEAKERCEYLQHEYEREITRIA